MIWPPITFKLFTSLLFACIPISQTADPCEEARTGAVTASQFAKDSVFLLALAKIKTQCALDNNEHCISFGTDAAGKTISSSISNGGAISGKVPNIANAFADLHNHPNNLPPDAGDFYGLLNINKSNTLYKTRFVITRNGSAYALLVTDIGAALAFTAKYPAQPPAYDGGPPGFAVAITDEAREMKYKYNCTDEMVLAFILQKYNTGFSLLKRHSNGTFNKLTTSVTNGGSGLVFIAGTCP